MTIIFTVTILISLSHTYIFPLSNSFSALETPQHDGDDEKAAGAARHGGSPSTHGTARGHAQLVAANEGHAVGHARN